MSWFRPRTQRSGGPSFLRVVWIAFCVLGWVLLLITVWSFFTARQPAR